MARLPRLSLGGHAHMLLQRGNNSQVIFAEPDDCRLFLAMIEKHAKALRIAVHAYVLMPSHYKLLATPPGSDDLPRLMQAVGRDYARHFNTRHERTGTLWEGRYRSTIIQPERFLLDCMVSIDLSPVSAGLATTADAYPWSSFRHWTSGSADPVLTPHAAYWSLGNTPFAREAAYALRVGAGLVPDRMAEIDHSVASGWVLGDPAFLVQLQRLTSRRLSKAKPGRPSQQINMSPI